MALDAGWAGIIGAAIGAVSTLAGNALTQWLQTKRADSLADKRRARLRGMLSGTKVTWRSLDALAASIGATEEVTTALLIEIDARASLSNPRSWALVSRAPWPTDVEPHH
jgi:hypothetical protein